MDDLIQIIKWRDEISQLEYTITKLEMVDSTLSKLGTWAFSDEYHPILGPKDGNTEWTAAKIPAKNRPMYIPVSKRIFDWTGITWWTILCVAPTNTARNIPINIIPMTPTRRTWYNWSL